MTNRDFDQSDGTVLAEFAGLHWLDHGNGKGFVRWPKHELAVSLDDFEPWSLEAPAWIRQSLLDAVRERGLEEEFYNEFRSVMYERTGKEPTITSCGGMGRNPLSYDYDSIMMLFEAPPEAICRAILELEGE